MGFSESSSTFVIETEAQSTCRSPLGVLSIVSLGLPVGEGGFRESEYRGVRFRESSSLELPEEECGMEAMEWHRVTMESRSPLLNASRRWS